MIRRFVLLLLLGATLAGCASGPSAKALDLQQGLLRVGLEQDEIRTAWGLPDRTWTVPKTQRPPQSLRIKTGARARIVDDDDAVKVLEVWAYTARDLALVFDDGDLVAWGSLAHAETGL
jgi:hypothetical protein